MYSVPAREETYGSTERKLNLVQKNRKKRRGCSASKIAGPNPNLYAIRMTSPASIKYAFRQ
jgi:hypothetical protein